MRTLGVDPMGPGERDAILKTISDGRTKVISIADRLSVIPGWLQQPMKDDQAAYDAAFREYQRHDPVVISIGQRLSVDQGPLWRPLSEQEESSLEAWTASVNTMYGIAALHFPTSSESDIKKIALLALGVAAFAAPLFLTEDIPHKPISFWPKPPELPWVKPSVAPGVPMSAQPGLPRPGVAYGAPSRVFGGEARTTFRSPGAMGPNRPTVAEVKAQRTASPGLPAPGLSRPAPSYTAAPPGGRFAYRSVKRT